MEKLLQRFILLFENAFTGIPDFKFDFIESEAEIGEEFEDTAYRLTKEFHEIINTVKNPNDIAHHRIKYLLNNQAKEDFTRWTPTIILSERGYNESYDSVSTRLANEFTRLVNAHGLPEGIDLAECRYNAGLVFKSLGFPEYQAPKVYIPEEDEVLELTGDVSGLIFNEFKENYSYYTFKVFRLPIYIIAYAESMKQAMVSLSNVFSRNDILHDYITTDTDKRVNLKDFHLISLSEERYSEAIERINNKGHYEGVQDDIQYFIHWDVLVLGDIINE